MRPRRILYRREGGGAGMLFFGCVGATLLLALLGVAFAVGFWKGMDFWWFPR